MEPRRSYHVYMGMSVREVLDLPVFRDAQARVLAGEPNLDRSVRWVHVAELADISYLLKGGELLLTTGMGIQQDEAVRRRYIHELADVAVAGLVVELGRNFSRMPAEMITEARRRGTGTPIPSSAGSPSLTAKRRAPEHEQWAARSRERQARRAGIPFPGLAPPTDGSQGSAAQTAALRSLRPGRIGLIPARRPADGLAAVGWTCFDDPAYEDGIRNAVWIGAILRSWENRFGARLLAIGPGAEIRLLVQRPPRTMEAAEKMAAEHSAFCTECAGQGLRTLREIAPALVGAPVWTFWWD